MERVVVSLPNPHALTVEKSDTSKVTARTLSNPEGERGNAGTVVARATSHETARNHKAARAVDVAVEVAGEAAVVGEVVVTVEVEAGPKPLAVTKRLPQPSRGVHLPRNAATMSLKGQKSCMAGRRSVDRASRVNSSQRARAR